MIVPAAVTLLAAGCATVHDPGWQGRGAVPFDAAEAQCRTEASTQDGDARAAAFTECMARQGWRRGGG